VDHGEVHGFDPNVEDGKIESLGAEPVGDEDASPTEIVSEEAYDILVIANNNPRFRELDLSEVGRQADGEVLLVDGWDLYSPDRVERAGLTYVGVGRPVD
jgi:hypothetical protein